MEVDWSVVIVMCESETSQFIFVQQSVKPIYLYKPTLFRSILISPDEGLLSEVETS